MTVFIIRTNHHCSKARWLVFRYFTDCSFSSVDMVDL
jgi:hypothetical protein